MNPLPSGDRRTQNLELTVFASLGFAGVMMVALALSPMTKSMAESTRRTAALAVAPPADASRTGTTNASRPAEAHAATRGFAPGRIRSASDSAVSHLPR